MDGLVGTDNGSGRIGGGCAKRPLDLGSGMMWEGVSMAGGSALLRERAYLSLAESPGGRVQL